MYVEIFEPLLLKTKKTEIRLFVKPATNCLFFDMTNENFLKLQLIQNHAARLVKRVSMKSSSATALLKDLHWLPIKQRVSYKIAIIVFKC